MNLPFPSSSPPSADRRLPEDERRQPIVGWRCWKLRQTEDGAVLQSVFQSERWEIGVTRATCSRCAPWMIERHPVPNVACQCGLHAFSGPDEAIWHAQRLLGPVFAGCRQPQPVVGAVVGWGRVIQHGGQGWRAEKARPLALLNANQALAEEAAVRYGIPLVSMRGLRLLPLEYGEVLPAA